MLETKCVSDKISHQHHTLAYYDVGDRCKSLRICLKMEKILLNLAPGWISCLQHNISVTNMLFVTKIFKWSPSLSHQHNDVTNIIVTHFRNRVSGWNLNSNCYLVPFWFRTDFYPKGNARWIMKLSSWINLLISDYLKCGFDADVDCMQCRIESKIRLKSHRWLSIIWVQSIIFLYL